MLHALHCHNLCYENTNESERHRTKFTLEAGAVLHVPHGICLATVFNWLRHRNEAPKSALHFGPGRYRLYWNRFHIGTGSRYPTLVKSPLKMVPNTPVGVYSMCWSSIHYCAWNHCTSLRVILPCHIKRILS